MARTHLMTITACGIIVILTTTIFISMSSKTMILVAKHFEIVEFSYIYGFFNHLTLMTGHFEIVEFDCVYGFFNHLILMTKHFEVVEFNIIHGFFNHFFITTFLLIFFSLYMFNQCGVYIKRILVRSILNCKIKVS